MRQAKQEVLLHRSSSGSSSSSSRSYSGGKQSLPAVVAETTVGLSENCPILSTLHARIRYHCGTTWGIDHQAASTTVQHVCCMQTSNCAGSLPHLCAFGNIQLTCLLQGVDGPLLKLESRNNFYTRLKIC